MCVCGYVDVKQNALIEFSNICLYRSMCIQNQENTLPHKYTGSMTFSEEAKYGLTKYGKFAHIDHNRQKRNAENLGGFSMDDKLFVRLVEGQ